MKEHFNFDFAGHNVRIVMKDGEPWFVLRDICDALEIVQTAKAVQKLDEDEVHKMHVIDGLGRAQETILINESGLYVTVIRSNKPQAKPFRKWVTSEVLPSIRKNGYYCTPGQIGSGDAVNKEARRRVSKKRVISISNDVSTYVWRKNARFLIGHISRRYEIEERIVYGMLYKHLERELCISLEDMVVDRIADLEMAGATEEEMGRVNKFRMVYEDPELREVFSDILLAMLSSFEESEKPKEVNG